MKSQSFLWLVSGLGLALSGCEDLKPQSADTGGGLTDTGAGGGDGGGGDGGGDDGATDTSEPSDTGTPDDTGTTVDPEPEPDPISATIRGTVEVQPYRTIDGARELVDAAELAATGFPYGAIFVAAYDETGVGPSASYPGTDTVSVPVFGPNAFELPITMNEEGQVIVYASLDENVNFIIETTEPLGLWPEGVDLVDGAVIEDIAITISVDWDAYLAGSTGAGGSGSGSSGGTGSSGSGSGDSGSGDSGSGSGDSGSGDSGSGESGSSGGSSGGSGSGSSGGTGGTEGCDLVIEGPITLNTSFEGSGLVMLQNTDGSGPVDWTWFEVEAGATESEYFLSTCPEQGQMRLVASLDTNDNGLIDPADTSGAYVSSPGVDGNPISIGTTDLTEMEIELPLVTTTESGEEVEVPTSGIELVPFVRVSGEVCHETGTFDTMEVGSTMLITALKYRPNTSVLATSFESDAYDTQEFAWADLTGQACVSYLLYVPANVNIYLWAYGDTDLDGTVNEAGEPVGNGGTTVDGLLEVGTTSIVQDFVLGTL